MPKTYLHLKDLFTKGQFGPVKPGMTMEEVEALIGEPHWSGENRERDFMHYAYNDFEIFFHNFLDDHTDDYVVNAFQNDHLQHEGAFQFPNPGIIIKPWILKKGLGIEEAKRLISAEGLVFGERKVYDITFLIFENGSQIGFLPLDWEREAREEPLLYSVGYYYPGTHI